MQERQCWTACDTPRRRGSSASPSLPCSEHASSPSSRAPLPSHGVSGPPPWPAAAPPWGPSQASPPAPPSAASKGKQAGEPRGDGPGRCQCQRRMLPPWPRGRAHARRSARGDEPPTASQPLAGTPLEGTDQHSRCRARRTSRCDGAPSTCSERRPRGTGTIPTGICYCMLQAVCCRYLCYVPLDSAGTDACLAWHRPAPAIRDKWLRATPAAASYAQAGPNFEPTST
mmetsp:Transcript_68675/g.201007  ORF Transcript_68675/g.201007 Transcript_68675/m.201007 type:complete len:228 (+) Transcript_68675:848-1531(+)